MGVTSIEWTATITDDGRVIPGYSFNPWWSCTEVSPACTNCYAREWAKRFGVKWGAGEPRRLASERTWAEPLKWNAQALKSGARPRVFCASMADVFDNEAPAGAQERLWALIEATPALNWLLLTKRIGNAMKMVPAHWQERFPSHVWVGATVVTQGEVDRDVPKLLEVPASIRFLSVEPMIEEVDLSLWLWGVDEICDNCPADIDCECGWKTRKENGLPTLDWVICGGESGRKARSMNLDWARGLRDQCQSAGVAFFFKQWGEWYPVASAEPGEGTALPPDRATRSEVVVGDFVMQKLGKRLSGRELDGRIWNEFPKVTA